MYGLAVMFVVIFLFAVIDVAAKWMLVMGIPVMQVVFVRYAGHFFASAAAFVPKEGRDAFRSNRPGLQFLRSCFLLGGTVMNFTALQYLPIIVTTAIYFALPVTISILSYLFLNETIGLKKTLAILVGFGGVLIIVSPWSAEFHWAIFFSLASLASSSGYFVMTRLLAGVESNSTSQLWASGVAMLAMAPFGLPVWVWPSDLATWIALLILGPTGAAAHGLAVMAHRYADASSLAPVTYVQAIWATLAGWYLFDNLPGWNTVIGTAILIASGIYMWWRERELARERQHLVAQMQGQAAE